MQASLGKADTAIQNLSGYATETYVNTQLASLVDSALETLNTLDELANALGDDPNFATTIANQIGTKVTAVEGKGLSTNDLIDSLKTNYDVAYAHVTATNNPHGVSLSQLGVNATATELNYVDGVTSNIQTQLNSKTNYNEVVGALNSRLSDATSSSLTDLGFSTTDVAKLLNHLGVCTTKHMNVNDTYAAYEIIIGNLKLQLDMQLYSLQRQQHRHIKQ